MSPPPVCSFTCKWSETWTPLGQHGCRDSGHIAHGRAIVFDPLSQTSSLSFAIVTHCGAQPLRDRNLMDLNARNLFAMALDFAALFS